MADQLDLPGTEGDVFRCPQRGPYVKDSPFQYDQKEVQDAWRQDGTCSYCGSVSGAAFMKFVQDGGEVTPTDKNYKAYCHGIKPQPVGADKFYFHHLDEHQKHEFIAALNAKTMKVAFPGHFYNLPYFVGPAEKGGA